MGFKFIEDMKLNNFSALRRPAWLVPGPDGTLPVQVSAWSDNAGYVGGQVYGSAAAYLAAAGGTFSRGSDAWRRDADGLWRKSTSNQLRLHHDADGHPLGALIEGQRSFYARPSRDLTDVNWTKRGSCTVTQDMAVARADGTLGAMRVAGLSGSGSGDTFRAYGGGDVSTGYAVSIMVRRISTSGTLVLSNANDALLGRWSINLALLDDTWVLLNRNHAAVTVVSEFASTAAGGWGLHLYAGAGAPLAVFVDFANSEFAAGVLWASSPMDPSTGSLTRLAEVLSYPAASPSEMTVVIDAITAPGRGSDPQCLWHWNDGTTNNRLRLVRDQATGRMVLIVAVAGTSTSYTLSNSNIADGTRVKVFASLKAGAIIGSVNGSAALTHAGSVPAGLTTVQEGTYSLGAGYWFGTIGRNSVYNKAYSAADAPGMSAL